MAFSVSPSVIIKEVDTTGSIPAVINSPAAIAGVFNWGPVMQPVLITSETELVARFGKPSNNNAETFFSASDFLSYSNALYVVRVSDIDTVATASGSAFEAKYVGSLGNSIGVSYVGRDFYENSLFSVGQVTGEATFASKILNIQVTSSNLTTTVNIGDILKIGNNNAGYQEVVVENITAQGQNPITNYYIYQLTLANPYTLSALDMSTVSIKRYWQHYKKFSNKPSTNSIHVVVTDIDGKITGTKNGIVEAYDNVSLDVNAKTSEGQTNFYQSVINSKSNWVSTTDVIAGNSVKYFSLTGGVDSASESEVELGVIALGYDIFKNSDQIDISFIIQGKAIGGTLKSDLANYIVSNIIDFRKDCVLFISPSYDAVVTPTNEEQKMEAAIEFRNAIISSSYWFMDSGYKYRYDKYNDVFRWTPLNGDVAGLSARIDPWESPAGYKRGVIKNAVKLAFNPNKTHRDALYGADINPVITQTGKGIILFGDKTGLGMSSAFDRINVRRLFITVEKSIATIAATFLFDFNDSFTQLQFKNIVNPYLANIQGKRGIIDFRVISDSTINTPDVVDSNTFKGQIFIKPARTISVIELSFIATRSSIEFDEVIGQLN